MPGDKSREKRSNDPPSENDISGQPTRREQAAPPGQIILDDSAFYSEGTPTHRTASKIGLPNSIGQYQIIRELGRGGMGVVYLAKQPTLNREVALKVLNINLQSDPEDAARFRSEAKLAAALQHPNIVQIYEIGEQDDYAFIAMEYVPGGSLHDLLKRGGLEPRQAAALLEPLARAMHYAHSKAIIHRDLKPGNILISEERTRRSDPDDSTVNTKIEGNSEQETLKSTPVTRTGKITDFGLAKQLNQSIHLTATGIALGTPSYMAPEQAKDDRKQIGPLSDVYALGAILYEMLTGKPPFSGSTPLVTMQQVVRKRPTPPREIRAGVPKELETICLKCLEKSPAKRYPNAAALADALHAFLEGPPVPITIPRGSRKNVVFAGVMLIVVIGSLIPAIYYGQAYEHLKTQSADDHKSIERMSRLIIDLGDVINRERTQAIEHHLQMGLEQCARGNSEAGLDSFLRAAAHSERETQRNPQIARVIQANLREAAWQNVRLLTTAQHGAGVNACAWSPDGKLLATAGADGIIRFFTNDGTPSGKPVECTHGVIGGARPAQCLAWSLKGDLIAVGGYVGHVYLWNVKTREQVTEPILREGVARAITQIQFLDDDSRLAIACQDGSIRIFDVATRASIGELLPRETAGGHIGLSGSPDGKYIAVGGKSGVLRFWERQMAMTKEHRYWNLGGEIRAVAFAPDGRCLVAATQSGSLFLWDMVADRLHELSPEATAIAAISFTPDGQTFATASEHGVRIWDTCSRQPMSVPIVHDRPVRSLAFHPHEEILATADDRGSIRYFRVPRTRQSSSPIQHEPGPDTAIHTVYYSKNGKLLTSSRKSSSIWDVGKQATKNISIDAIFALSAAMSPDATRVALGGYGGRIELRSVTPERNLLAGIQSPLEGDVRIALFSLEGSRLLTIATPTGSPTKDKPHQSAYLWTDAGSPKPILRNCERSIQTAAWGADGKHIALGCADGSVILWNVELDAPWGEPLPLGTPARSIAFSRDGKYLAAGGLNGTGKIWKLEDRREASRGLQHSDAIVAIAFSPDGNLVLTGSHDQTARYWDSLTGWPIGPPLRHPQAVLSVAFHPNSQHAVTGCQDATARFWRLPLPTFEKADEKLNMP